LGEGSVSIYFLIARCIIERDFKFMNLLVFCDLVEILI